MTVEAPRIGVDRDAAAMCLRGTAIVRGIIDATGRVLFVDAQKALPPAGTMDLIRRGLSDARYQPAQLDGRAVPIGVAWIIHVDAYERRVEVDEPRWPVH